MQWLNSFYVILWYMGVYLIVELNTWPNQWIDWMSLWHYSLLRKWIPTYRYLINLTACPFGCATICTIWLYVCMTCYVHNFCETNIHLFINTNVNYWHPSVCVTCQWVVLPWQPLFWLYLSTLSASRDTVTHMKTLFQGSHSPSPLIEKDIEKGIRDFRILTCQVLFHTVFRSVLTKFHESGTWTYNTLAQTLLFEIMAKLVTQIRSKLARVDNFASITGSNLFQ